MKCPNCGGKGKYKNVFGKVDGCYYCLETGEVNGKGEQVHTNEGWFCGLSTEEKARFFSHEMRCEFCPNQEQCDSLGTNCKVLWEMWLKQPHTIKE